MEKTGCEIIFGAQTTLAVKGLMMMMMMTIPLHFASLYFGQVFVWSDCLLDLGTDFLVGNMGFV